MDRRFRSIEEMSAWQEVNRNENTVASFNRFLALCQRFTPLRPRRFTPGVEKFRSIEEAQNARRAP